MVHGRQKTFGFPRPMDAARIRQPGCFLQGDERRSGNLPYTKKLSLPPAPSVMFARVSELQNRDLAFDLSVQPGEIDYLDDQITQQDVLRAKGTVRYRASTREILLEGALAVTLSYACDRCLERVLRPVQADLNLAYLPEDTSPTEEEREISEDETELAFYQGGGIDLTDVFREQVLLELPMRRVCEPECAGSPLAESHRGQPIQDPRWSALESYRPATPGSSAGPDKKR